MYAQAAKSYLFSTTCTNTLHHLSKVVISFMIFLIHLRMTTWIKFVSFRNILLPNLCSFSSHYAFSHNLYRFYSSFSSFCNWETVDIITRGCGYLSCAMVKLLRQDAERFFVLVHFLFAGLFYLTRADLALLPTILVSIRIAYVLCVCVCVCVCVGTCARACMSTATVSTVVLWDASVTLLYLPRNRKWQDILRG